MGDEIELKLELSQDAAAAIEASDLLPRDVTRVRQSSYYFDTPDHALARAGLSLRIRKSGDKRVQTIKAAGVSTSGLFARSEWERSVLDDSPVLDATTALPPGLNDRLDALAPMFEAEIDRRSWLIVEGHTTIEMVLDRGEIVAGDRRTSVCEIELELKAGDPAALFALARKLDGVAPVRLGVLSKAERGYRLTGPAPVIFKADAILLPNDIMAARAFGIVAQNCIRQYRLNEALLLSGCTAGALHQARVALRRLRSAFSIFRPIVGKPNTELAADLCWLTSELGSARNLDVLLARTRPGPLHGRIAKARDAAHRRVGVVLALPRTRQLMLDLAEWIALGPRAAAPAKTAHELSAKMFAITALDRCYRRAKKRGNNLADVDDTRRHEVRKAAKKLRYASDFLASLFSRRRDLKRYARFNLSLEELQDQLGMLNDLATASLVLDNLGFGGDPDAPWLTAEAEKKRLLKAASTAHRKLFELKRFWR